MAKVHSEYYVIDAGYLYVSLFRLFFVSIDLWTFLFPVNLLLSEMPHTF